MPKTKENRVPTAKRTVAVLVPESLHKAARVMLAGQDSSFQQLLVELLEKWVRGEIDFLDPNSGQWSQPFFEEERFYVAKLLQVLRYASVQNAAFMRSALDAFADSGDPLLIEDMPPLPQAQLFERAWKWVRSASTQPADREAFLGLLAQAVDGGPGDNSQAQPEQPLIPKLLGLIHSDLPRETKTQLLDSIERLIDSVNADPRRPLPPAARQERA